MSPDQPLIDQTYREKVIRARAMSPEEKFDAGYVLFEQACEVTRSGIRFQHPQADEEQVGQLLEQRLAIGALLDEQSRGQRRTNYGS